ncbi:hypothetical protein BTJ39_12090 [Izhakiella australiensis]|uniref:Uncharacterized protein n=1 Tax=Izhakiella australiensis TaxID=1926881 RepID=A0A1S8YLL1_9GAMM|nr:hypothetical protein BTJ39_12090 [Izhakiella australiensis]
MPLVKMTACVACLLMVGGCASQENVPNCHTLAPAPAAWAMRPASNSLLLLDKTFSLSGPVLSATGKK